MINLPSIFFYIFVAPKLVGHITFVPIVIYGILQIISTVLMLATALVDPGIIPKTFYDRNSLH